MKRLGWSLFSIALVWLLYFVRANVWFRFYPVIMVALVWTTFTVSLFRRPLIECVAARMGAKLDAAEKLYCLKVTRIWVVFLTLHLLVTILTLFAPLKIWALYNGFLAYVLMGSLFFGERVYRLYIREGRRSAEEGHRGLRRPACLSCADPHATPPQTSHPPLRRGSIVLFRTSGTSGAAKEIPRSEASLQADAEGLVREFPEVWGERGVTVVSSVREEHMYGALWRVRAPKIAGLEVDPAIVTSVEQLLDLATTYKRILFVTTPSFLEKALKHPDFLLLKGKIKDVITSGSLLRRETSEAVFAALGISPLEIFGCTEVGTVASRRQKDGDLWQVYSRVRVTSSYPGLSVVNYFLSESPFTMSDAVEMVDETHFKLLGRTDRRVKILEKYVSLPEIEAIFEEHPLVERARAVVYSTDVPRLGMLIVPSHAALETPPLFSFDIIAKLRSDLLPKITNETFPRRIRFVRQLPTNEQGKTTESAALAALNAWAQEPFVTEWNASATELTATLVFPRNLRCFEGHFPDFPILPGVAQLYYIRHFARQVFPDFPEEGAYRRLKFQKVILPKTPIKLHVVKTEKGFECSLTGANGVCASYLAEGSAA